MNQFVLGRMTSSLCDLTRSLDIGAVSGFALNAFPTVVTARPAGRSLTAPNVTQGYRCRTSSAMLHTSQRGLPQWDEK
jgi:hypothetical protein